MGTELLILIGSIVGGTGAMLSFWAGWRARDQQGQLREAMRTDFTEGRTQRGNGSGGPPTPKPAIIPKPQPPAGRVINAYGETIGYMPIPSRSGTNPPPREP